MKAFTLLIVSSMLLGQVVLAKPATFVTSLVDNSAVSTVSEFTDELPDPALNWTQQDYESGKQKVEEQRLPLTYVGDEDLSPIFKDSPGNKYPIVLVHGFLGFGNPIFGGILDYFGGFAGNVKRDLEKRGYQVFLVDVGPLTSNWERAAELYHQIKGGTVDFGLWHSQKYGHQRYGRTYKGLYPEWSPEKPVHLIGHSMGGPTARALVDLLARGSSLEIEAEKKAAIATGISEAEALQNMSYLYAPKTKSGMVHGVITVSSPMKGSTVTNVVEDYASALLTFLQAFYGFTGAIGGDLGGYDFRLEHWGLVRQPKEKLGDFIKRIKETRFLHNDCNGFYDNSVAGTREFNKIFRTDPNTYFFSITNSATCHWPLSNVHRPIASMNPLFSVFSYAMGRYTNRTLFGSNSASWHENDGVVNFYGMDAPEGDAVTSLSMDMRSKTLSKIKKSPSKGVWNTLDFIKTWDHLDVVGLLSLVSKQDVYRIYRNSARLLRSLPPN